MATIDVIDLRWTDSRLARAGGSEVFAPDQINEALLWEAVKLTRRAAARHAATKNKKLVSGSGKKLWKQRAQAGLV